MTLYCATCLKKGDWTPADTFLPSEGATCVQHALIAMQEASNFSPNLPSHLKDLESKRPPEARH